jgi:hypothetical protein
MLPPARPPAPAGPPAATVLFRVRIVLPSAEACSIDTPGLSRATTGAIATRRRFAVRSGGVSGYGAQHSVSRVGKPNVAGMTPITWRPPPSSAFGLPTIDGSRPSL